MESNGRVLRVLFGAVVFFGVIWVLFVGILANHATAETMTTTRTTMTTTTTTVTMKVPSTENFKQRKLIAREKNQHHTHHQDSDLNYVSKRRVPNGPDPIHNRRASKARQPPGRI